MQLFLFVPEERVFENGLRGRSAVGLERNHLLNQRASHHVWQQKHKHFILTQKHLYIHKNICTYTKTSVHTQKHLYIHKNICTNSKTSVKYKNICKNIKTFVKKPKTFAKIEKHL